MPPLEKLQYSDGSTHRDIEERDDFEELQTTPLKSSPSIISSSTNLNDEKSERSSSVKKKFLNFSGMKRGSFTDKSAAHQLNDSMHSEISIADEMKKKLFDLNESQTEIEITYLNTISSLSAENDQAKNQLDEMKCETSRLSETNKVLECKLSQLELELEELKMKRSDLIDNQVFSCSSDDSSLLTRSSKLSTLLKRVPTKIGGEDKTDQGSVKSGSSQRSALSDFRMQFLQKRISISNDNMNINLTEKQDSNWEFQYYSAIKQNHEYQLKIQEAHSVRRELEAKLQEETAKFDKEVEAYKNEIEKLKISLEEDDSNHILKEIEVRVPTASDVSPRSNTENKMSDLDAVLRESENKITKLTLELESKKSIESEIAVLRRELDNVNAQLVIKSKEADDYKERLDMLRLDFITTQQRNTSTFEELEEIRELYEAEVAKTVSLEKVLDVIDQTQNQSHNKNSLDMELDALRKRLDEKEDELKKLQDAQEKTQKRLSDEVLLLTAERNSIEEELSACDEIHTEDKMKLQKALETKDDEIKTAIDTRGNFEEDLKKQLLAVTYERTKMMDELRRKNDEIMKLNEECSKSNSQLAVMENDIKTIQRRNSRACEELDELREQFAIEVQQKVKLKEQLEHCSPDEILKTAKKENDEKLSKKDNEIKELKSQLDKAKESRNKLELKLVDVMNDAVATQSTRNLMKADLEMKLNEENEKAAMLENLIEEKESDIKRLTKEFDILRIEMKKEMYLRREEISDLNGEVVQKSNLLSSKEREFLQFKSDIDDMNLKHRAELEQLQKQIDDFDVNQNEIVILKESNRRLRNDVSILKNELQRLTLSRTAETTPDSSAKVLRARNEQLMNTVERLNEKIKRIKRNVILVEL